MDAKKDYSLKAEQIARFAKALAHPARIQILQFLARRQECYFGDIHEELPIAKATVSQHLRELKDAGLIQYARELFTDFFANEIKGGSCGCDSK